jgi:murein DD-endopeptidase MepM/ murein hydrolase activator NlpD
LRKRLVLAVAAALAASSALPSGTAAQQSAVLPERAPAPRPGQAAPPSAADAPAPALPALDAAVRLSAELGRGDTLLGLLTEADVPTAEAHAAIEALRAVFDPRRLRAGQRIDVLVGAEEAEDGRALLGLEFAPDASRTLTVARAAAGGFAAAETVHPTVAREVAASVAIESSLYEAALAGGVPIAVTSAAIRALSHAVDFQRDLQEGDRFDVLFERHTTEAGDPVRDGEPAFVRLVTGGRSLAYYRFEDADGFADWFDRDGRSIRRALMRTPIDGARLSSRFGMRRHPVLGYSAMHKGVDFAAPTGTPIYAAGDGVVEEVGPRGAYGNYVRVRHAGSISTAYAHLSRFARGLQRGARVRQGQVIGYVGSTGRSTGPHLHYEVLRDGRQVNPLSVELPAGRTLAGAELAAFRRHARELDERFRNALPGPSLELVSTAPAGAPAILPRPKACAEAPGC